MRVALPPETAIHAGISTRRDRRTGAARQEADECLALHEAHPHRTASGHDESWHAILLRATAHRGSTRVPARGPVTELRRRQATPPSTSPRCGRLTAQGDLARAGEAAGRARTTVRYRLRKMVEVTALDLDDPYKRLAMTVELAAIPDGSP